MIGFKSASMKRLLFLITILCLASVAARAQGAGLSQGEAVKNPSPTPQATVKRCPECGIVKGNVTYPWQHEPWCPYYRPQGSSGASSHSSTPVSQTTAGLAANVLTSALGAALVAGVGAGVWRDFSILESIAKSDAEAAPDALASSDYSSRYARWLALSGKLGEWAK